MPIAQERDETLFEERLGHELRVHRRTHHRDVDFLRRKSAGMFLTEILSGDRHIGKSFCVVLSNEVDRFPQSPPDSDVEPLGLPFLDRVRAVQEVSDRTGDRACCVEQGPTLARHLDASPMSGEQRHSELLFQVPDLARQRWLGDVQTLGGSGETSLLYDGDECT